jgi:hypothetical protein
MDSLIRAASGGCIGSGLSKALVEKNALYRCLDKVLNFAPHFFAGFSGILLGDEESSNTVSQTFTVTYVPRCSRAMSITLPYAVSSLP